MDERTLITHERTLIASMGTAAGFLVTMDGMNRRSLLVAVLVFAGAASTAAVLFAGAARSLPDLGPALDLDRSRTGASVTPSTSPTVTPSVTSSPSPTAVAPRPTSAAPRSTPAPKRSVRVAPAPPAVRVPAPPPADDDADDRDDDADDADDVDDADDDDD